MATPTTSVLFDGTTVTGLTNDPFHGSSSALVASGGVFGPGASTYSEMWAASPTWTGNGEAYLTISTIGTSTDPAAGAYAGVIQQPSASVATADGYQIGYLWAGTPKIEVYKYTNAVIASTPISQTITALSAGDAIFLLVSGGVLTASVRRSGVWSTVTTASDATYTFSGGGAVAEWAIYDPNGVCRIDNLGGGAVASGTGATVTAVPVAVTVAVPAPAVTGANAGNVAAVPLAVTAAVPAPAIAAGATVAAAPMAVTAAMVAPAGFSSEVGAAPVSVVVSVPAPAIGNAVGATVTAPPIAVTAAVPSPTLQAGATVTAAPVSVAVAIPAPAAKVTTNAVAAVVAAAVAAPAISPAPPTPSRNSALPLTGVGS